LSRPPVKPVDDRVRIVLAVLHGEVSIKEAARREQVSETSIAAWRDQFLDGGRAALTGGARHGPSGREAELQAQVTTAVPEHQKVLERLSGPDDPGRRSAPSPGQRHRSQVRPGSLLSTPLQTGVPRWRPARRLKEILRSWWRTPRVLRAPAQWVGRGCSWSGARIASVRSRARPTTPARRSSLVRTSCRELVARGRQR
jgi:transposase